MSGLLQLNIIGNRIVYRAFALVQRQAPYVDLLKFIAEQIYK